MKKLLVLALAALILLSLAAVSMAADTTISGSVTFVSVLDGNLNPNLPGVNGTFPFDENRVKLDVNNQISDEVSISARLQATGDGCSYTEQQLWAQFSESFNTIKVGFFDYNQTGSVNLLGQSSGAAGDIGSYAINDIFGQNTGANGMNAALEDTYKLSDTITLDLLYAEYVSNGYRDAVDLAYNSDTLSADVAYIKPNEYDNTHGAYSANVSLKFDPAQMAQGCFRPCPYKIYANYQYNDYLNSLSTPASPYKSSDLIVGLAYDSGTIFAGGEYDLIKFTPLNSNSASNQYGIQLGYHIATNTTLEYDLTYGLSDGKAQDAGAADQQMLMENSLKLIVNF